RSTHFVLFYRVRRVVTIVGIPDQQIVHAKRVDRFCHAWSKRNHAAHRKWYAYAAAGFILNCPERVFRGRSAWSLFRAQIGHAWRDQKQRRGHDNTKEQT